MKDWINLCWLGILFLTLATYWLNNASLLAEFVDLFKAAVSDQRIILSEGIVNFVFLFAWLSAVRFAALMVFDAVDKEYPLAVGSFIHTIVSLIIGHILISWSHNSPSPSKAANLLLIFLGFYILSKGVATGWFHENNLRVLKGNWVGIVQGVRIIVLSFFVTEENLSLFQGLTVFFAEKFGVLSDMPGYSVAFLAFLEICLFTFLLTEFPKRLIFYRCKRCGALFLKISVSISSWDAEHASKHRHCPMCGAACF